MEIDLRFFASLREALGPGERLQVPAGSRVIDVRRLLQARGGAYAEHLGFERPVRCALARAMCQDEDSALSDGAELAFFPPVTGG